MSSRRGRAARDVETVDLTMSSPSPSPEPLIRSQPQPRRQSSQRQPYQQQPYEQHPRLQPQQQYQEQPQPQPRRQSSLQQPQVQPQQQSHQRQQNPVSTKGEHRTSSSKTVSNKTVAGPSHRTSSTAPPAPKINEVYLRRLIDTTPVGELKDLLLELCKTSPALSGAIVRGLAPHSTWAQNTIRDYQKRAVRVQVKHANSSSAILSPASSGVLNHGLSSTSRPTSSVKPELDPLETDSDSSLKDLQFLMNPTTPLPKTPARSKPGNSARSDLKVPSATQNRPPSLSGSTVAGPSSKVKSEPRHVLPYCMQCEERAMPKSTCRFHVGRPRVQKKGTPGVKLWTCCTKPLDSVGCCEAEHMLIKDPISSSPDSSSPIVAKRPGLV